MWGMVGGGPGSEGVGGDCECPDEQVDYSHELAFH